MAITRKYTYADLLETPDDGKRYEIIDGELYVSPSPSVPHQRVIWNLVLFLARAEAAGLGKGFCAPLDIKFDDDNVTEPDLMFITSHQLSIIRENFLDAAPDLLIEVLSPGTRYLDVGKKLRLYARFRARYYWLPDPIHQTVRQFELTTAGDYRELPELSGDDELTCPLFPGISTPVSQLFR